MIDDVTVNEEAVNSPAGEVETPQPTAQGEPKPTGTESTAPAGETTVPDKSAVQTENLNKALKQERERVRKLQREMAEIRGKQGLEGYDPTDLNTIRNHPYVQDLELKSAERDLKDHARDVLSNFPDIPKVVANAIIKNPRGYVKPTTTDIENAKLDLEEYITDIVGELEPKPEVVTPKTVTMMGNNSVSQGNTQDSDIAAIQAKPPEDWTAEEQKVVSDYIKRNKGRG